ncbi:hypothetical protein D3C71_2247400 [compost metagenome]
MLKMVRQQEIEGICARHFGRLIAASVVGTGLQQQDLRFPVFRQPGSKNSTGGARSDDNNIV